MCKIIDLRLCETLTSSIRHVFRSGCTFCLSFPQALTSSIICMLLVFNGNPDPPI